MMANDIYLPTGCPDDVVAALDLSQAVVMLLDELDRIAARPASERQADVSLLVRTNLARKAGVGRDWLCSMLQAAVDRAEQTAREAAIHAAAASGQAAQSLALWGKVATGVTYAPPADWLVDDHPAGSGRYRLLHIGATGVTSVGPLVYPTAIIENGDVYFHGYDQWGRVFELAIGLIDLSSPAKVQAVLAASGAWMVKPRLWIDWVQQLLASFDLRVPDPEPTGTDWAELVSTLRDLATQTGGATTHAVTGGHHVIRVPVSAVEAALGRKVSSAERRRWAERGFIVRAPDGRFAGLARVTRGGPPIRCLYLVRDALDGALAEEEAAAE